jgi:nucleoside recognition membrane protein YjiH
MKSPPVIEKLKRGPVGLLTVLPSGPPAMGKNMVQWFLYCLVISIFAAYLSGRLLTPGTAFLQVFRVVGTVAFLGYGAAHVQESIWSGRSWVVTLKHLFDSVIYAVLTAATFGWLWPKSL